LLTIQCHFISAVTIGANVPTASETEGQKWGGGKKENNYVNK